MNIIIPTVEISGENKYTVKCAQFVAEIISKYLKYPAECNIDYSIGLTLEDDCWWEMKFAMPANSIGHVEEGWYEYDEWENVCSALRCHVHGAETYVAQHMGGSGDSQYDLVKSMCYMEEAFNDLDWYRHCEAPPHSGNYVSKPVPGKVQHIHSEWVPVLCPKEYRMMMVPKTLICEMSIIAMKDEIQNLCSSVPESGSDVKYILDKLSELSSD